MTMSLDTMSRKDNCMNSSSKFEFRTVRLCLSTTNIDTLNIHSLRSDKPCFINKQDQYPAK
jgi:hypothetical protein